MRTIRFWTSHNCRDGESWRKRLYLPEEYRFVFDETDPEYLLVSEHLYVDAARMKRFFELNDGSRIVVWHNGEAVFPDMNLFDYAYVFDRDESLGDRICRIPTESKGTYMVYLYFPPKAGKFDGWVGTAYITIE